MRLGNAGSTRLLGLFLMAAAIEGQASFARIVEINRMSEILPEIDLRTVVVFDLDNTVIEAKQMLGSDMWYEHLSEKYTNEALAEGLDPEKAKGVAIPKAVAGWMPYQMVTEVNAVEDSTPQLIRDLQARGLTTIGLTARPFDLAESSARQLESVNVDFRKGGALPKKMKGFDNRKGIGWHHGVIFVGLGNDKGEVLRQFLKANGVAHRKVVFVDDKVKNVQAVDNAYKTSEVPCVALRYGAADPKVRAFDARVAEIQRELFGKILSDESAMRVLDGRSKKL